MSASRILDFGIHDNVPDTLYHSDPGLSYSGMKILAMQTPAHFRHWVDSGEAHKTEFDFGTAAHRFILEDSWNGVRVLEYDNYKTKAAQTERDEAYAAGEVPILRQEKTAIVAMRDQIAATPIAKLILAEGHVERSLVWNHTGHTPDRVKTGTRLRARIDKHLENTPIGPIMLDLKTTTCADPRKFGKTAADFGYFMQHANYVAGMQALTGRRLPFMFVLVEKQPPYLASIVELDDEAVNLGRRMCERATQLFADCTESGNWPGYPLSDPVALPVWATRTIEDTLEAVA